MSVLDNPRHEEFAQRVAVGDVSASAAYVGSGYGKRGARQSASRLLNTPKVRARIDELRAAVSARLKNNNIRELNARSDALQPCETDQRYRIERIGPGPGKKLMKS